MRINIKGDIMKFFTRKSGVVVSALVLTYVGINPGWAKVAEEEAQQHGDEYISEAPFKLPRIQWEIVGAHTGKAIGSEKFIKPARDCALPVLDNKNLDYLLQLDLCKANRKGWLKI